MTPGIQLVEKAGVDYTIHEYTHDASADSYGLEAADKLGITENRVFKTLVVNLDKQTLAVAIIPVSSQLSMKLIAKAAGAKKAQMAEPQAVERATGYVLGGVSPLGQKKRLKTFVDVSASQQTTIYVSAGKRGLEIELAPDDLLQLVDGAYAELKS